MDEKVKAFFENFIQNCEQSEKLNSIETAYYCNWAKWITSTEITPLPSEKNIVGVKISINDNSK